MRRNDGSAWIARLAALPLALAIAPGGCERSQRPAPAAQPAKASAEGKPGGTPRIACAKAEHDFGTVFQGARVEHVFSIRNEGDGVLQIKRASGG